LGDVCPRAESPDPLLVKANDAPAILTLVNTMFIFFVPSTLKGDEMVAEMEPEWVRVNVQVSVKVFPAPTIPSKVAVVGPGPTGANVSA
jgi:hypothetical protein